MYWERFLKKYYIFNTLAICTFLLYRFIYLSSHNMYEVTKKPDLDGMFGFTREVELCIIASVYVSQKCRKIQTIDELVDKLILYMKLLVLVLCYHFDIRIMIWYGVLFGSLHLCLTLPEYDGPENMTYMNHATFNNLIVNGKRNYTWVVYITSKWATSAKYFKPTFAELSMRYGRPHLKFACIDVGMWPEVAKVLKINTDGLSWQIPSVILFEEKTEVLRLPPINVKGDVTTKVALDKAGVVKYFELERRMIVNPNKNN